MKFKKVWPSKGISSIACGCLIQVPWGQGPQKSLNMPFNHYSYWALQEADHRVKIQSNWQWFATNVLKLKHPSIWAQPNVSFRSNIYKPVPHHLNDENEGLRFSPFFLFSFLHFLLRWLQKSRRSNRVSNMVLENQINLFYLDLPSPVLDNSNRFHEQQISWKLYLGRVQLTNYFLSLLQQCGRHLMVISTRYQPIIW